MNDRIEGEYISIDMSDGCGIKAKHKKISYAYVGKLKKDKPSDEEITEPAYEYELLDGKLMIALM